jgi:hypothetical protein
VAKAEARGESGHLSRCTCMSACVGVCAREARSDAADKEVGGWSRSAGGGGWQ